jgi:hypothetical protein
MRRQILSWLRDTGNLTVRYILVGFAFVPAGLLYVELAGRGRASVLSMGLSLALGFVMANAVWQWSATKRSSETLPVISQGLAAALAGPAPEHWAMMGMDPRQIFQPSALTIEIASRLTVGQPVATRLRSHEVDYQRVPQFGFAQRAGAAHAAFSSNPS